MNLLEQCHRVRCLFGNHFFITQGDMMLVRTEIRCQSIESRQICFTINQGKYSARMTKAGVPFIGKIGPLLHNMCTGYKFNRHLFLLCICNLPQLSKAIF